MKPLVKIEIFNLFLMRLNNTIMKPISLKNIEYAVKRALYHYSQFEVYHQEIKELANNSKQNQGKITFKVKESIFYEFDAFMYSSRTIFENSLHHDVTKEIDKSLLKIHKKKRSKLIALFEKEVLSIRNDVVHLNKSGIKDTRAGVTTRGTTYGFSATHDQATGKIILQSTRFNNDTSVSLIDTVHKVQYIIALILDYYLDLFVRHLFPSLLEVDNQVYKLSINDLLITG